MQKKFSLCQYKDALGKPNQGIHRFRFMNMSIFDVIMTFVGAWAIQHFFFPQRSYWLVLFLLFVLGVFLHRLFCVKTTIDMLLFG